MNFLQKMERIAVKDVEGIKHCRDPELLAFFQDHSHLEVYRATYFYGDTILADGRLHAPLGSDLPPDLDYQKSGVSSIPLGLITRNFAEIFERVPPNGIRDAGMLRTNTIKMLSAGDLFGVFETADFISGNTNYKTHWNISAGATSIGITARLGDQRVTDHFGSIIKEIQINPYYQRYRDLRNDLSGIVSLVDWHLTRRNEQIRDKEVDPERRAKIPQRQRWSTEVVLFPKLWLTKKKLIERLQLPLLKTSHRQSSAARYLLDQRYIRSRLAATSKIYSSRLIHLFDVLSGFGYFFEPVVDKKFELGPFLDSVDPLVDYLSTCVKRGHSICDAPTIFQPVNLSTCQNSGYISLRGWPFPGDNDLTSGKIDAFAKEFTASLCKIPGLSRKLEAAALVFFAGGSKESGKTPRYIFHELQAKGEAWHNLSDAPWGKINKPYWGKLNLAEERVEVNNAKDVLVKPVIKVVPRKLAF